MKRRVKIVATIGPSSQSRESLSALIQAGIDVARLNFSHGTHAEHLERIHLIRALSVELHKPVSILQDLQGPKLRVGTLPKEGVPLETGEILNMELDLENRPLDYIAGKEKTILLEIPNILHSLKTGSRVLLDDGDLKWKCSQSMIKASKPKSSWAAR
jgi:pyruvate kinase